LDRIPKNESDTLKGLHRFLFLEQLAINDSPAAAVEYARDYGVKVGKDCRIYLTSLSHYGPEPFLIELGDNVLISGNVQFITHDGGIYIFRKDLTNIVGNYGKIKIGNNCFIGYGAIILPNVQLGDNCIVCAGAIVTDSFPENSIIMGNPAKLVFKTSIYRKMKLSSRLTLTNDICSFPEFDTLPYEVRKKFILERIGNIPIKKPHRAKNP
jgi:acetyltransferase-like isoleucine patch superfamily enzyme